MLTFNEGKVCEAILQYLETREGCRRSEQNSPESINHAHPVELTWKFGTQLYALEHTGIEPFDEHMRLTAESPHHFDPIKSALTDILKKDILEIHVPAKAMQKRSKAEIVQIQNALIDWIRRKVPELRTRSYADHIGDIPWETVPNVPFSIRLFRFENLTKSSGWVKIVHVLNGNLDQQRSDRLQRACDKKFPKLAAWKRNHGARTILVLEDNDIQLTNYEAVAKAYIPLALKRNNRPDETYLVSTCTPPWNAWPLMIDDQTLYSRCVDGYASRWEIDPTGLTPATSR